MAHVILEHLNGLCKLSGDWTAGVGSQPAAQQMQDVHWYQGGLRVSWRVKCLAMLQRWYGLFGGELSCLVNPESSCLLLLSLPDCWVSLTGKLLFLSVLLLLWQFMCLLY